MFYIAIQELFTGSSPTSLPCSRPGQHLLSNTVRRITELPGRTAFKWWGVWDQQPLVRLFGGDPGGTRNGPAVPSPRGTGWSPPDCLSTSSAALGRCVSRRATRYYNRPTPSRYSPRQASACPLTGPCLAFVNQDWDCRI